MFSEIIGKKLLDVSVNNNNDEIYFDFGTEKYKMYHDQDCCESVAIESIDGDIKNLIGEVILDAREESNSGDLEYGDTFTWTFYIIRTNKDSVTIRWYGSSNGYYSESVSFKKISDNRS